MADVMSKAGSGLCLLRISLLKSPSVKIPTNWFCLLTKQQYLENSLYIGIPAKFLKTRNQEQLQQIKNKL